MGWAIKKKGLSEVMFRADMSLYDSVKITVKMRSAYSEEFEVKVGVHQESVLSPLLFAIVVDVITENARRVWFMNYYMKMTVKNSVRLCHRCDSNSCFDFLFYLVALVSFA